MGLHTSHGCWTGSHHAFNDWRRAIAKAAGLPPLDLMNGFFDLRNAKTQEALAQCQEHTLAIKWSPYEHLPITKLLNHSDCDGVILVEDCEVIADALQRLLPALYKISHANCPWPWILASTVVFIQGLRDAAKAGENVEFH